MKFEKRVPRVKETIDQNFIEQYDKHLSKRRIHFHEFCERIINSGVTGILVDLSRGWGYVGIDILKKAPELKLITVGDDAGVLEKARSNAIREGVIDRWDVRIVEDGALPFSDNSIDAIISTNTLRKFDDPCFMLKEMWRGIKPGGAVYISDLRRDADPNITEYIVREMSEDRSPPGQFSYDMFMKSWGAAYTIEEIGNIVSAARIPGAVIEEDGAMSVLIEFKKS